MKRLALLFAVASAMYGQVSSIPAAAGGGSSGTGLANQSCTFVTSATTCAITGLAIPAASYSSSQVQCFVGASTTGSTQTPLTNTWAPTIAAGLVTTVTATFSAASGAGYCALNSSGVTGPTGATGTIAGPVGFSTSQTLTAGDCPTSQKTFTGSSALSLTLIAGASIAATGCPAVRVQAPQNTLTIIPVSGGTANGQASNIVIPACPSQPALCPTAVIAWDPTNTTWDVGGLGAVGPTGPTGNNGSNGSNGAAGPTGPQGPTGSNGANGTGNNTLCADATGSTTAYTCPAPSPTVTSLTGLIISFIPQTTSTGTATVNVAGLGAKQVDQSNCSAAVPSGGLVAGSAYVLSYNGTVFCQAGTSSSSGVSAFSGDGTLLSNSSSSGTVTATLANANGHTYFGNNTGSPGPPGYNALVNADLPNPLIPPVLQYGSSPATDATDAISNGTTGSGGSCPSGTCAEMIMAIPQVAMAGAATSGTVDGTHKTILVYIGHDFTGNGSPTIIRKIRACSQPLTGSFGTYSCGGTVSTLWSSSAANMPSVANLGDFEQWAITADTGGTAGQFESTIMVRTQALSATSTGKSQQAVCSACTGGAWTLYYSVTFSASGTGTAACSNATTTGTNCISNPQAWTEKRF